MKYNNTSWEESSNNVGLTLGFKARINEDPSLKEKKQVEELESTEEPILPAEESYIAITNSGRVGCSANGYNQEALALQEDQSQGRPDMINWSQGGRTQQILDWMQHINTEYKNPGGNVYRISYVVKRQWGTVGGNMGPNWKTEYYQGASVEVYYLQKSKAYINCIGPDNTLLKIGKYSIYMQGPQCGNCRQPQGLMGILFSNFSQFNNAWRYIYGTNYMY